MAVRDLVRQYEEAHQYNILVDNKGNVSVTYEAVQRLSDDFAERLAAIRADKRLSAVGKSEAINKLARDTRAAMDKWRDTEQQRFDDYLNFLSGEIRDAVAPHRTDDANQSSLRREVRDAAKQMDALQREQLYRKGNATVRAALEELDDITVSKDGGVVIKPFVSKHLVEEVLLAAGREALPETAARIDATRAAEQRFHILAGALRDEVSKAIPAFASDAKVTVLKPA